MKTFAAINVGSFELTMKIFEFIQKAENTTSGRMRQIDSIRRQIDLGSDTYANRKISNEKMDELCRTLKEFADIMKTYQVEDYQAYGTSAIRESDNIVIILDQIKQRTGIRIEVLSNSEQRYLDYKSLASKEENFRKIIEEKTAIVDIGGGSIQISLFDNDTLVSTQNMRLGVLRIQEHLTHLNARSTQIENLVDEMTTESLATYKRLYLKDREIQNLIIVDDYISVWAIQRLSREESGVMISSTATAADCEKFVESLHTRNLTEIALSLDMPEEKALLLYISAILVRRIVRLTGAQRIWAPGVTLCDGIAYDYGEKKKLLKGGHNFEKDIVACAINISKRYMGSKKQAEGLEKIALTVFDSTKKLHGLGKRERLYLKIAVLLSDCGRYISLVNMGEASYSIIMATEIIGLSDMEREIIANVVRYNYEEFTYHAQMKASGFKLGKKVYLLIAKLTALLGLASALNLGQKQKWKEIKANLREDKLMLLVETMEDLTLEKGQFHDRAKFFQEVFSVQPIINQKK